MLRSLPIKVNTHPPDGVEQKVSGTTNQVITPRTPSGNVNNSGSGKLEVLFPTHNKVLSTTKRSLFLEHGESEEDERGCLEAVTRFLAAITAGADKDGKRPAEAPGASPALLQTSKGAGSIECRESARELLRFFGHAPLLHLEGIVWVKTTGERGVVCFRMGSKCSKSLFNIGNMHEGPQLSLFINIMFPFLVSRRP